MAVLMFKQRSFLLFSPTFGSHTHCNFYFGFVCAKILEFVVNNPVDMREVGGIFRRCAFEISPSKWPDFDGSHFAWYIIGEMINEHL